ncbi:MAG: PQQ-binding-like beta-propeller repeat protein, partial [Thermoplasmata archaeon]
MRVARVVILSLLVVLLTSHMSQPISILDSASANGVEASDTTGSWSEFRGNLNNTGYSISRVPSRNGSFLRFDAHFQVRSSPVLSDGVLYFGSDYGHVYAVNISTKKEVWNLSTGGEIWASALVVDDKVFVGSTDNNFYAIDRQSGIPVWTFPTGDDIPSSAKHVNGTIVFGSHDGNLYFLDAETGNETVPHFATNGGIYGTPAIVDGTAVIGSNDGNVYRVWLENG